MADPDRYHLLTAGGDMAALTFQQLAGACRRLADRGRMAQVVADAVKDCEPVAAAGVKLCFVEQKTPDGEAWPKLKHKRPGEDGIGEALRDTGRLMASIVAVANGTSLTVGTNRIGARLLHYGGVVVPVNAKFLCIPATVEAKRAKSPRNFDGRLIPMIRKGGISGVLIGPVPEGVRPTAIQLTLLEVQFYMTKRVEVPSRRFVGFSKVTVEIITIHVRARCLAWIWEGG